MGKPNKIKYQNTCNILGVEVAVTDMKKTLRFLCDNIQDLRGKYICVSNVHTVVTAYEDEKYRKIQNTAAMVLPDGKPLSLVQRKRGFREAQKVSGPDLMPEIFHISEEKGYTHFFYGSTEETLEKLGMNLRKKFPKLEIAGAYSPPFRSLTEREDAEITELINKADADFVWVGLGAPKQEIWMAEHEDRVHALMIGVGAGFDFHAGTVKRAPKWMQRCCLEWLYRLFQDPKRLFKRYAVTNVKFLRYLKKHTIGQHK